MSIKNIIFDNGGVLSNPRTGHWFMTTNFWKIINLDKNLYLNKINESMKKNKEMLTQEPKTELEEYNMFSNFYYQVLKDINFNNNNKEIANKLSFDCVYNDDKYLFFDDVEIELQRLEEKYNLYLITDAWPSSYRIFDNLNISKYFKEIIISSIESTTKKEGLFDIFLEKNKNIVPQESIIIDDRSDILDKAIRSNFNVILMDRTKTCINNKYTVIHKLKDIEKIII